ncbi:hypothetical protein B0T14DRAFT_514160 [Immersiella caudata]|uniref:Extracellular membrane protein CFEM domain-containing protein n=1 Tax=Immersiella caudata TaxID=314043 RepID=A0AA39WW15_9PEZI|nr:hypothetical protein B0T14DRAFT_514160 [Immersiella caudata]
MTRPMLVLLVALAAALPTVAEPLGLHVRHDGDHSASPSSTGVHAPHHTDAPSGTGHGHGMNHGAFNFTPSGIPWPQCLRDCCNSFFEYFPEPVNNPLCVNQAFYTNVTKCVVADCTQYEQGAFAVVAAIECPKSRASAVTIDEGIVAADLVKAGGKPQSCEGVKNETIVCKNGTAVPGMGARGLAGAEWVWVGTLVAIGGPLAYFL